MSARFRGTAYRALLPKLPRNLVIFDGHCLLCQARVQFALERNFSFFGFLTYFSADAQTQVNAGLDRHTLYFASLDSLEGSDVKQLFLQKPKSKRPTAASSTVSPAGAPSASLAPLLPFPDDLVVIFVEKIPSKSAAFLRRVGGRVNAAKDDSALFTPNDPADGGHSRRRLRTSSSASDVSTRALANPDTVDLFVTTNFSAMCRIGMHLDRVLWRTFFTLMYYAVPRSLGDWAFNRAVCRRRHVFWGHSEEDAVMRLGRIEGMKERRWAWRTQYKQGL